MTDVIAALEDWFSQNCDGDWEHGEGVRINTLDNPGWALDIDLAGTQCAGRPLEPVRAERDQDNWVHCWVDGEVFKGRGGPRNLGEIVLLFLRWSACDVQEKDGNTGGA
jgi:hypothetical protein